MVTDWPDSAAGPAVIPVRFTVAVGVPALTLTLPIASNVGASFTAVTNTKSAFSTNSPPVSVARTVTALSPVTFGARVSVSVVPATVTELNSDGSLVSVTENFKAASESSASAKLGPRSITIGGASSNTARSPMGWVTTGLALTTIVTGAKPVSLGDPLSVAATVRLNVPPVRAPVFATVSSPVAGWMANAPPVLPPEMVKVRALFSTSVAVIVPTTVPLTVPSLILNEPPVTTGVSLTGFTVMVKVSVSDLAPPDPVLPRSSEVMVTVTGPLKSPAGVKAIPLPDGDDSMVFLMAASGAVIVTDVESFPLI